MSQPPPAPPRSSAALFMPSRRPSGTGASQPSRQPPTTSAAAGGSFSRLPGATSPVGSAGPAFSRLPQQQQQSSAARFARAMDVDSPTEGGGGSPAPRSATEHGVSAAQIMAPIHTTTHRPISRLPGSSTVSASPNPPTFPPTTTNGARPSRLTAASTSINRSHPGLQPPSRPPSTPSLDLTLRRLLLLLPTLLESLSAPPLPMLDGLFPGEVREGFEAKWKEEERRKGEERKRTTQAALKASEGEIRAYVKNLVEEVGGAGVAGGERLEKLEKGLEELLDRPTSAKVEGDEEKMEQMEKKIYSLEASLARQRTAYEAQLQSYEARFSALEARLSSSPSNANHEGGPGAYITQRDLQDYANKVDHAMQRLDGKGTEVARRVGVEWRSAPAAGEVEEEGGLLRAVERVKIKGEDMGKKVGGVEKRVGELEVELRGVASKEDSKVDGGDVVMRDTKEEQEDKLLSRLLALESTLTSLQSSLPTTSTVTYSTNASLESQLSALQLSTAQLQTDLEAKIQAQADRTGEKLEALRMLTTYFQVDNRLASFGQLTSHWPAIKLILEAWKAQHPPPAPSAVNGHGGGEGSGSGAEANGGGEEMEPEQEGETPVQVSGASGAQAPSE